MVTRVKKTKRKRCSDRIDVIIRMVCCVFPFTPVSIVSAVTALDSSCSVLLPSKRSNEDVIFYLDC
jgi:hypothetical protein